jgi:hypothetical protein
MLAALVCLLHLLPLMTPQLACLLVKILLMNNYNSHTLKYIYTHEHDSFTCVWESQHLDHRSEKVFMQFPCHQLQHTLGAKWGRVPVGGRGRTNRYRAFMCSAGVYNCSRVTGACVSGIVCMVCQRKAALDSNLWDVREMFKLQASHGQSRREG